MPNHNWFAGRGVFLSRSLQRGEFIVEYAGELISGDEGDKREEEIDDCSVYRYFFNHNYKYHWLVRQLLLSRFWSGLVTCITFSIGLH